MDLDLYSHNILMSSGKLDNEVNYWLEKLQGNIDVTGIPVDYRQEGIEQYLSVNYINKLSTIVSERILHMGNNSEYGVYIILLACVKFLLYKYTGTTDVIVNMPAFSDKAEEYVNGNVFALRTGIDNEQLFKDFIININETVKEARRNKHISFEKIVELTGVEVNNARVSLFKTVVSMNSLHSFKRINKLNAEIIFDFIIEDNTIAVNIAYNSIQFKNSTIEQVYNHLQNLISIVAGNINQQLKEIDILSEAEKKKIVTEFNSNKVEYPEDKTLTELFEQQVDKIPNSIALEYEGSRLTYRELNENANQLARVMQERGIEKGNIIGVLCNRCDKMLISILAIFKVGGIYLPIDPEYPADRIKYMLENSGTQMILTYRSIVSRINLDYNALYLEDDYIFCANSTNLEVIKYPSDIAYVIYTSGSTGFPKGALIEHAGMVNHIYAKINDLNINSKSKISQNSSHCFDISIWQFLAALVVGGKTVIYPNELVLEPDRFIDRLDRDGITILEVVPSFLSVMLDKLEDRFVHLKSLIFIIVTGEAVKASLIRRFFGLYKHIRMVNAYGPTEASDDITHYIMEDSPILTNIPIGKPIQNLNIYIVDSAMKICPIGVTGEIWVSGVGVGRGYINNAEKTAETFTYDPFCSGNNRRLYKTGDLGKWLSDGSIEFLGRKDYQVKIRGFRIELEDIENKLLSYPGIREAVVIDIEDENGEKSLWAYITTDKHVVRLTDIKNHLKKMLAYYMIPSYFVKLDKFPLNSNGKIDRKELRKLNSNLKDDVDSLSPENDTEMKLLSIWKKVLGVERIGTKDNFFELGGHSLKAASLISKIHKVLNAKLTVSDVFKYQTIKELAQHISKSGTNLFLQIEPAGYKEYYTLSSAQKRIFIVDKILDMGTSYNMPGAMMIKGKLDLYKFNAAFRSIVQRHESLRTLFYMIDGEPVQRISSDVDFNVKFKDMSNKRNGESIDNILELLLNSFVRIFKLDKAPLLRVELVRINEDEYFLLYDIHHIISDGVSKAILINEFIALYTENTLEDLKVQYKDFTQWQSDLFDNGMFDKQEKYWLNVFKNAVSPLKLPTDYDRPIIQSFDGDCLKFQINEELMSNIKLVLLESGITLFMLLIAVYNVLLSKYTNQEDIVVGTPFAGRPNPDLENIIGMFVNTVVMRNYPRKDMSFKEFLGEVKRNSLEALENQDYPFEKLVDKLSINRDPGRNMLFDTMFVMQNIDTEINTIGDLSFIPYEFVHKSTKFDLLFEAVELKEKINFRFEYSTKLFKRETVEKYAVDFKKILSVVVKNPEIRVSDIEVDTPLLIVKNKNTSITFNL